MCNLLTLYHNLEIFNFYYKHETFLAGFIKNISQQICTIKKMLNIEVQKDLTLIKSEKTNIEAF